MQIEMKYNLPMPQKQSRDWLVEFAGLFTIGGVAVISFVSIDDNRARWVALGITLAFAALHLFQNHEGETLKLHLYLATQTALAISLIVLQPNVFASGILFFVLSATVMVCLPTRPALLWIGVFAVITYFNFALTTTGELGWCMFCLTLAASCSLARLANLYAMLKSPVRKASTCWKNCKPRTANCKSMLHRWSSWRLPKSATAWPARCTMRWVITSPSPPSNLKARNASSHQTLIAPPA